MLELTLNINIGSLPSNENLNIGKVKISPKKRNQFLGLLKGEVLLDKNRLE